MATTYELISSNVLTSSAASVTFSSIPSTYTDLVLRVSARSDSGTVIENLIMQFNNDTATNYSITTLGEYSGTTPFSAATANTANPQLYYTGNGSTTTANTFSNTEIYIPNYLVSANKPFSAFGVIENNATDGRLAVTAALWRNTAAISSLKIITNNGLNIVSGSSFYLYGIKNS